MSSKGQTFALLSYDEIPGAEHSQTLKQVWAVCQSQQERIVRWEETGAQLRDERAILKGEKPRPQIKPSTLNKDTPEGEGQPRRDGGGDHGKQPKELEIHELRILPPEQIPAGSVFRGYEDDLVQGLRSTRHNTKYRRAR